MKVLLTHGYFLCDDPKEQDIMRPYPPLGLLYISAYLEQHGVENKIFDTTFSSKTKLENYLLQHKPKYLGIYVNLMTKINVLRIISFVKNNEELKNTTIFLGGPEVRYNAEEFLRHDADFIVIGEGEETTLEMIHLLESGGEKYQLEEVNGLAFINDKNDIVTTGERAKLKDINELPLPNRSAIDLNVYLETWKKHHSVNAVSVNTMRGCPYTCKWCSRAVYGLSYRRRSPQSVISELKQIKTVYNPDSIWFVDDVFTISHKWLADFNDELKSRNIKIPYECISRADRLNERVIKLLKESGCFRIWIGAESGSQKVIDLMNRRVKVEKVREMIKLTKKFGIEAGTFIMLGYPGETEDDIEKTIKHLKDSNPDHFTITTAYPIKGTELYNEIEAYQTVDYNFESNNDRDRDFKRTYSSKYYIYAVNRVVSEVMYYQLLHCKSKKILPAAKNKLKSVISKICMKWERIKQKL